MAGPDIADAEADVVLSAPESRGGGFHRYERYRVTMDGLTFERDTLRVGKVAVILPLDLDRGEIVLIRQFRLGAHLALGKGDLVEVPAGHIDRGEEPLVAARRECEEETGVTPHTVLPIFELMPSPGASDEHMFFFLALLDSSKLPARAGLKDEHEDTRPFRVPIDQFIEALRSGKLHYGAAVIALQWLALNRDRLPEIVRRGHP